MSARSEERSTSTGSRLATVRPWYWSRRSASRTPAWKVPAPKSAARVVVPRKEPVKSGRGWGERARARAPSWSLRRSIATSAPRRASRPVPWNAASPRSDPRTSTRWPSQVATAAVSPCWPRGRPWSARSRPRIDTVARGWLRVPEAAASTLIVPVRSPPRSPRSGSPPPPQGGGGGGGGVAPRAGGREQGEAHAAGRLVEGPVREDGARRGLHLPLLDGDVAAVESTHRADLPQRVAVRRGVHRRAVDAAGQPVREAREVDTAGELAAELLRQLRTQEVGEPRGLPLRRLDGQVERLGGGLPSPLRQGDAAGHQQGAAVAGQVEPHVVQRP